MIKSFKNKETLAIWKCLPIKKFGFDIKKQALRKLDYINSVSSLEELRIPPKNCLEALSGDRKGQHSIRINNQFRICFVWDGCDAYDVEIVDYHK